MSTKNTEEQRINWLKAEKEFFEVLKGDENVIKIATHINDSIDNVIKKLRPYIKVHYYRDNRVKDISINFYFRELPELQIKQKIKY